MEGAPEGKWMNIAVWAPDCDQASGAQPCLVCWGGIPSFAAWFVEAGERAGSG